jgi:signal peptidase I
MTDFDEQFRKQFEGEENEENNEDQPKPQPEPQNKKLQDPISPKTETVSPPPVAHEDLRRERIRKKFFKTAEPNSSSPKKPKKHGFWHHTFIGTGNILIIIGIVVLIRTFFVSPFSVVGSSMANNLADGDLILVDKMSYRLSEPKRGDVIVFHPPTDELNEQKGLLCEAKKIGYLILGKGSEEACFSRDFYVKRIIGVPGDTVEIRNRNVYVTPSDGDRTELQEEFLDDKNKNNTCFSPSCNSSRDTKGVFVEVPNDAFYVLGDNRSGSNDSRKWKVDGKDTPFVRKEDISGKVRMVFFPFLHISVLPKIDPLFVESE